MTSVLLYSGGMDSWLIDKIYKPDVKLFIDTKTQSNQVEKTRLPSDVIVKEFDLSEYEDKDRNFLLPLRNLIFVEIASYYGDEIYLGSTATDVHFDNSDSFVEKAEDVINYLYSETHQKEVRIIRPFKEMNKTEMLRLYLEKGGDIQTAWDETFSCYTPIEEKMCGQCTSCQSKIQAFKNVGYIPNGVN